MAYILSAFLRKMIVTLKEHHVFEPEVSAERILSHLTGISRMELYAADEIIIYDPLVRAIRAAIGRRLNGEPVAYITGECEFYNIKLKIDNRVLVPRPETEILVEESLKLLRGKHEHLQIADIGTGSGNIAISLAANLENIMVIATDVDSRILELARGNADLNGVSGSIEFREGELFSCLVDSDTKFDAIISNPPYLGTCEKETLPVEVRKFEPPRALFAGDDGLSIIDKIIELSPGFLKPDGFLALEIGYNQGTAVRNLMQKQFENIKLIPDYNGYDRVLIGSYKHNKY